MSNYKKCIYEIAKEHMLYAIGKIKCVDNNVGLYDVPVYSIIFNEKKIIAESPNINKKHAEEIVLNDIDNDNDNYNNLSILITLEPCPSCAFKILKEPRIKNIFFGGFNYLYGSLGGKINLSNIISSKINIYGGIYKETNENIVKLFFKNLRNNKLK